MTVIHIKPKTRQPWDAETSKGGYWYHACCNWRVDCPACGLEEALAGWISPSDVADSGTVKGERRCKCGFGGQLVLDDFPAARHDLQAYKDLLGMVQKL